MTLKNNRAPLLYHIKLCASVESHGWTQTRVTVRKRPIHVKICDFFLSCVTLKFDRWPWQTICCIKLCASFRSHLVNSNWSYSPEMPNLGQNRRFVSRVTLKFDGWPWKTIGHLLQATSSFVHHFIAICEFKTGVTVRKRLSGVMTSVTLTFDLWPWPFAWTSHLSMQYPIKAIPHDWLPYSVWCGMGNTWKMVSKIVSCISKYIAMWR